MFAMTIHCSCNHFRRGSTIVDAEIETRGFAYEAEAFHQVTKTTLTQEIADGKLGSFTVDKTFLIHGFPVVEEGASFSFSYINTTLQIDIYIQCHFLCLGNV